MNGLSIIFLFVSVVSLQADFTARVVSNDMIAPFVYTGRVSIAGRSGSGAVVGSEFVMTTAAHFIFNEADNTWFSGMAWLWRNENWNGDEWSSEVVIRSLRHFGSYADAVQLNGTNDPAAFAEDFAAGLAFESLTNGNGYGTPLSDPAMALANTHAKQIVGFPQGLYPNDHLDRSRMHTTGVFTSPFERVLGEYYFIEQVSMGPGASGGGTWIKEDGQWHWAAVYVSGLETSLGGSDNLAGVVANAGSKASLLSDVIFEAAPHAPEVLAFPASPGGGLEEATLIEVTYRSFPMPEIVWYRRGADGIESEVSSVGSDEYGRTWIYFPPADFGAHGVEYRVSLSTDLGADSTPWMPFTYKDVEVPSIISQPISLYLAKGEGGALEVEVSGYPEPQFIWESEDRWGTVSTIRAPFKANYHLRGARMEFDPNCLEADGARLRLRVVSYFGEDVSDWMNVKVSAPALTASYLPLSNEVIPKEGSITVQVESEHATEVDMEYAKPFSSVWHWTRASGSPGTLWSGVFENRSDQSIHDYRVRAKVWRAYDSFYYGRQAHSVVLPEILLRAEGPPMAPGGVWSIDPMTLALQFSSVHLPEMEWQVFDASAGRWRPVPQGVGHFETDHLQTTLHLAIGADDWRFRVVMKALGEAPVPSRDYRLRDTGFQMPATFGMWHETRASSEGIHLRLRSPKSSGMSRTIFSSDDMVSWDEAELNSVLLEADCDGDGATALWEVALPASSLGAFYRIEERAPE